MSMPSQRDLPAWLRPFTPFLTGWPLANRATINLDAMAGLTGALVALPQGVAFATIAGMPPQYGLYAGMVPAMVAALFGSSWHLVSGPTTATSIFLYSVLAAHAELGSAQYVTLALTLTLPGERHPNHYGPGPIGHLSEFYLPFRDDGLHAGAVILIATKQVNHFFGLEIPRRTSFEQTWETRFTHLGQVDSHLRCGPIDPAVGGCSED